MTKETDIIKLNLKTDFDPNDYFLQASGIIEKCQKKLDAQALKDCNYYCPMDTGTLQKSAIINSVIGSGRLVWNTPYALDQYYNKPNKSHQKNPNAVYKWCEVAQAKNQNNWEKLVNDEYNKNN